MKLSSGMAVLALSVSACTWETGLPSGVSAVAVEPMRELVVVDPAVIGGPLSKNALDGPLSFRHAMSHLALRIGAPRRWLDTWAERLSAEHGPERAASFREKVTCGDLAGAPFRLLAVVNRTDLSVMPDRRGDGGEGRLVFALTDGPADDPASRVLPFRLIFEYVQDGAAVDWARRWHSLGRAPVEELPQRLAELAASFVERGAIAQIRSSDAWTGPMTMHQWQVDGGELIADHVRNTPDWQSVDAASLRRYVDDQATALDQGTAVMPREWWASESSPSMPAPAYVGSLPRGDQLVTGTCSGCHAKAEDGFHIDAGTLSRFLVDPASPRDELRRRVEWMQIALSR